MEFLEAALYSYHPLKKKLEFSWLATSSQTKSDFSDSLWHCSKHKHFFKRHLKSFSKSKLLSLMFPTSPNKSGNYAQLVPTSRLISALFPYTIFLVSYRPLLTINHPHLKNKNLQADLPSKTSEETRVKTLPLENSSFFKGGLASSYKL